MILYSIISYYTILFNNASYQAPGSACFASDRLTLKDGEVTICSSAARLDRGPEWFKAFGKRYK